MPHLDTALDVVIKDDGCCTQCGAPISALVLGGLCAACATKALEPPEPVATETQIEARRALARRELARRHLIPYIQYQMPNYHAGWVHWDIAARLERLLKQVIRGESPRLILDMPPRTGKSLLVSQFFPGWALGQHPWLEFINASHTASLAVDFSRKVRSQLEDPAYPVLFDKTKIDENNRNVMGWKTTDAGGYLPAGVGGSITGKGAHCAHFSVAAPTRGGLKRISDIRVGDEVLGYDHGTKRVRWTVVRAISTSRKPELVDVCGALLTPDHLVWTEECGYVPAAEAAGHTVSLLSVRGGVPSPAKGTRAVPATLRAAGKGILHTGVRKPPEPEGATLRVRAPEGVACSDVCGVSPRGQARGAGLLYLWDAVRARYGRAREESTAAWHRLKGLLLSSVLRAVSAEPPPSSGGPQSRVRRVWGVGRRAQAEEILQRGLLSQKEGAGFGIRGSLEPAEAGGCAARRSSVRELREGEGSRGGTPHRPRRNEPRVGEPGAALRSLPQPLSSSVRGTCAADLAHLLPDEGGHWVVDIQTSTGNFFCGDSGLLVHNCLIIDDFLKNREEANSQTIRDSIWQWYSSTAYTRLAPGGGVLVIATRWHDDDLVGRLIAKMRDEDEPGDQFEIVKYPAIAEHDEYRLPSGKLISLPAEGAKLLRKKGEALHPERWPLDRLLKIKAAVTPDDWAALYQQDPQASTSAIFTADMVRYYDPAELPKRLVYYTFWDLAIGQKQTNDWTVGTTVGVDEQDNIWVVNVQRGRWDAMEIVDRMIDTYRTYHEDMIGVEKGHISMAIGPFLQKRIDESPDAKGMGFFEVPTGNRDKVARSRSIQGRMKQGKVRYPRQAPWLKGHLDELFAFDKGKFDDQVDSISGIGIMLDEMVQPGAPKKAGEPEWMKKVLQRMARTASSGRDWRAA